MARQTRRNDLLQYVGIGLEFTFTVGVFVAGGIWLGYKRGSLPIWTIAGVGLGLVCGLYRLIRQGLDIQRRWEKKPPPASEEPRRRSGDDYYEDDDDFDY